MSAPDPAHELGETLTRVTAALDAGDTEAASVDMEAAADLCRRLLAAGFRVPSSQVAGLRELYERCGIALVRMGDRLNAASFEEEQQRRGLDAYQATAGGGRSR